MENNQRSSSTPHLAKPVLCDGFLIPMTDFVNNVGNMENYPSHEKALSWIYNYATFLKQPLKLEMFVPCDEGGNIIPIPKSEDVPDMPPDLQAEYWYSWESDFNKAKEKILFDGFYIEGEHLCFSDYWVCTKNDLSKYRVEDLDKLLMADDKIKLTQSALYPIFG